MAKKFPLQQASETEVMAIVKCKPTSAGRRHMVKIVTPELHKGAPYAPLLEKKSKTGDQPGSSQHHGHADDGQASGYAQPCQS